MKERIKKQLIYLIILIIGFYILPFFIRSIGSGITSLFIISFICVVLSFIYGFKEDFDWLFSVLVMILFLPTVYLHYNSSALIYCLIYGVMSLISMLIGSFISRG